MASHQSDDPAERMQRLVQVQFAIVSSLQQEMLSYNLQKDAIKTLVVKICKSADGFPDAYLQQMLVAALGLSFVGEDRWIRAAAAGVTELGNSKAVCERPT